MEELLRSFEPNRIVADWDTARNPKIGDDVIVHELLYFSVPNHGRLWKSLMRANLGDYEAIAAR